MSKPVFINLPVRDAKKSQAFYSALGFVPNPQFSDGNNMCMVWSEHIYVMLLEFEKFESFITKPMADTLSGVSELYSLSLESVEEMHRLIAQGLAAGGKEPSLLRNHGFMQQRTIEDFDGHTWELFYMDMSKLPQAD